MPGEDGAQGVRFIPRRVRIRPLPPAPEPEGGADHQEGNDGGFATEEEISHETAAVDGVLLNLPRHATVLASDPNMNVQQKDEIQGPILEVHASVTMSTRQADDDLTATLDQHKLDARMFLAMNWIELSDVMTLSTIIQERGLENTIGGRFPPQDMSGFMLGLMGHGGPEKEAVFDRFAEELTTIYRPSKLVTWFHSDTRFKPDEPAIAVPLVEMPELVVAEAFPNLPRTPGYHAWIQRYRNTA